MVPYISSTFHPLSLPSAGQESFSFSTKDRAPYLVTLEVLDSRQQRFSPSFGARARPAAGGVEGGASVAAGDDSGAGGGRRGGGRLIRMLTPRALGQSLREIADNTLTTLKIGGSAKEGRRDDDGSGSSGERKKKRGGGGGTGRYDCV